MDRIYTEEQVARVLESCGITIEYETADDFMVMCVYHDNRRTPAGEVNKETGTFYCFSCNTTATLEKLVMYITQRSYFEAVRLINSKKGDIDVVTQINKTLTKKDEEFFDQNELERLHGNLLGDQRAIDYLKRRGIAGGIEKYLLGYSTVTDMVTVPVHNASGKPLGFVARSIEGKQFKNTSGMKKSKTLFNLHRVKASPEVTIVESSFDAIRLDLAGIPAVASLGAGVSKYQIELLENYFSRVIIVPDADQAGKEMRDKLIEKMGARVTSIALPNGAKDVGDLTDENLKKLRVFIDNPLGALL